MRGPSLKNNNRVFCKFFFDQAVCCHSFYYLVLFEKIESIYGKEVREKFEEDWDRFLDDCKILLEQNLIKPDDLLNLLNNLHPAIKFTMETSNNKLPFLDISINKEGNKIWMDIYSKPTDSKRYVSFDSCHPKHCLKNIPFCLARRICMIVERDEIKNERLQELKILLQKQKYPVEVIEKGIEKASKIPQCELRTSKTDEHNKNLALITTHNPNNPNIFPLVKNLVEQLKHSNNMKNKIKDFKLINSKRQPLSLERILCKTEYVNKDKLGAKKCGKNCVCCNYILECKSYQFKNSHLPFIIKSPFTCISKNLLYIIICSGCKKEYIGQTSCMLKERLVLYRQHINEPRYQTSEVEEHLRNCGKGYFSIIPFLQIRTDDINLRETMELKFIRKYAPELNKRR